MGCQGNRQIKLQHSDGTAWARSYSIWDEIHITLISLESVMWVRCYCVCILQYIMRNMCVTFIGMLTSGNQNSPTVVKLNRDVAKEMNPPLSLWSSRELLSWHLQVLDGMGNRECVPTSTGPGSTTCPAPDELDLDKSNDTQYTTHTYSIHV